MTTHARSAAHRARSGPRRGASLLAVGLGNVAGLSLGLVSGVIASRTLGATLRGEFVAAQTWATMCAMILLLGVSQAVVTYRGDDDQLVGPLITQAFCTLLIGGVVFVTLSELGELSWLRTAGIVGGAALTTGTLASALCAGFAQRLGRMTGTFQSVRLVPQAAGVVAIIVVWRSGSRDPNLWLLAVGLAVLIPAVTLLIRLAGGWGAIRGIRRFSPTSELVRGAGRAFRMVTGSLIVYSMDSFLVAIYLPSMKVGLYAVAVTAAGACVAVGQAVGMLTFSRMRGVFDPDQRRSMIRRGTVSAVVVTATVAVPVAAIAPWAIKAIYGATFEPATSATRVLVLAAIPLAADIMLLHALLIMSASRSAFRVQMLAAVLTLVLLAMAISNGSLVLIALVSVAIYSLSATLLFLAAIRHTRMTPGEPLQGRDQYTSETDGTVQAQISTS